VQVKSRRDIGSDKGWHFRPKHADQAAPRLFYCLVDFGKSEGVAPIAYVLPSQKVAEVLTVTHLRWLAIPGKKGQAHNDNEVRRLIPDYSKVYVGVPNPYPRGWLDEYRDRWDCSI
jgi:hypothetical protein